MLELYTNLQTRLRRDEGQTMAEYGVVLGVITVALIAVFGLLGDEIQAAIEAVISKLAETKS